jgi:hypothetical protein
MDDIEKLIKGKRIIRASFIKSKRTLYSYVLMYDSSEHFLQLAKQNQEGRFYNCMASMIFCAFCLEAYFNHLCKLNLKHWKSIEQGLGPEKKFDLFDDIFNISIDRGARPFQSMPEIFNFRNLIVHAKTQEVINEPKEKLTDGEIPKFLKTEWENKTNIEIAERFVTDTREMIIQLHKIITGTDTDPFSTHSKGELVTASIDLQDILLRHDRK